MKALALSLVGSLLLLASSAARGQDAKPGEWGTRPAEAETVATTPPSFSWRPQKGARGYELECARSANFNDTDYRATGIEWNVHRPTRTFEAGEWFWRWRAQGAKGEAGEWSEARSFTVPEGAADFPLPPRDELLARIPTEHPRLFLRPEDLPGLRERVAGELKEPLERLCASCEKLLVNPPSAEEPPRYPKGIVRGSDPWREIWWGNRTKTIRLLEGAATLAFTWRLGGKAEYGELGRRLLLEAAEWDPKGATGYRYNDEAGMPYAYHFSRAYTFVHPLLTEAERERCREVMAIRGAEMYDHLCPNHLWRPYSSHSNRAWHFLGEVGIAFFEEIPEAGDWVWFAANVFANVYPVWSDEQGGWHEGNAYWNSYLTRFTWWADVQRAALGLDAYRSPFFSRAGDFALYTMPPGTKGGGFGDLNAKRTAQNNRSLMTVLAAQARNPYWQWYVDALGGPDWGGGYIGLLRQAAPSVEPKPPTDLPTSHAFLGTGLAVLNKTLESAEENVEVLFKSSPFGTQSHGYESNNSFLLYAFGERLLIRSGYRDSYGSDHHRNWMWQTRSTNCVTVDGKGQVAHSAAAQGRITAFYTSPELHYVEGEAGAAYGGELESFRRGILFVEPDLIVVHDRLRAKAPVHFTWHLHAPEAFEIGEDGEVFVRSGAAACRVDFFEPEKLAISQTDRFDPPPRERIRLVEHHLSATTFDVAREATFLTVIRPYRQGEETLPAPRRLTTNFPEPAHVFLVHSGGAEVFVFTRQDGTLGVDVDGGAHWNTRQAERFER